jgi:hypothetical protein
LGRLKTKIPLQDSSFFGYTRATFGAPGTVAANRQPAIQARARKRAQPAITHGKHQ